MHHLIAIYLYLNCSTYYTFELSKLTADFRVPMIPCEVVLTGRIRERKTNQ